MRLVIPVLFLLAACGDPRLSSVESIAGDPVAGSDVYAANCASCHGASGEGGAGPALPGVDADTLRMTVLYGKESMPAFDGTLTDTEIADVTAFVTSL